MDHIRIEVHFWLSCVLLCASGHIVQLALFYYWWYVFSTYVVLPVSSIWLVSLQVPCVHCDHWRYEPVMSTVATSLCSLASITPVRKTDLLVTVRDTVSSLQKSSCCLQPSAQNLLFILLSLFSLLNVAVERAFQFCLLKRFTCGTGINTISCNWVNFFFSAFCLQFWTLLVLLLRVLSKDGLNDMFGCLNFCHRFYFPECIVVVI